MFLFSTNSNINLAKKVARLAKLKWGKVEFKKLKDGETYVRILEKIKNKKVYVLGSTFQPESNFIELVILLNALKVNQAKEIVLLLPYFGYARQDFIDKPGAPLSAQLMADFLKLAGADKIIAVDLHSQRVAKFFGRQLKHLSALPLLAENCQQEVKSKNLIVVAPDKGAKKRASQVAKHLGLPMVVAEKYRPRQNIAWVKKVAGDLAGKDLIIIDDMVDTAGTLVALVEQLKQQGAQKIYCTITHPILSDPVITRIKKSKITKLFTSDSIPLTKEKQINKIKVVSLARLLAKEIVE